MKRNQNRRVFPLARKSLTGDPGQGFDPNDIRSGSSDGTVQVVVGMFMNGLRLKWISSPAVGSCDLSSRYALHRLQRVGGVNSDPDLGMFRRQRFQ